MQYLEIQKELKVEFTGLLLGQVFYYYLGFTLVRLKPLRRARHTPYLESYLH